MPTSTDPPILIVCSKAEPLPGAPVPDTTILIDHDEGELDEARRVASDPIAVVRDAFRRDACLLADALHASLPSGTLLDLASALLLEKASILSRWKPAFARWARRASANAGPIAPADSAPQAFGLADRVLLVRKANPHARAAASEGLTIPSARVEIRGAPATPGKSQEATHAPSAERQQRKDAEALNRVLRQCLPGGTYDQLIVEFAKRRASSFIVPLVD